MRGKLNFNEEIVLQNCRLKMGWSLVRVTVGITVIYLLQNNRDKLQRMNHVSNITCDSGFSHFGTTWSTFRFREILSMQIVLSSTWGGPHKLSHRILQF